MMALNGLACLPPIHTTVWPRSVADGLLARCRQQPRTETCGVLFGSPEEQPGSLRVAGFLLLRNTAADPSAHFAFAAEEWVACVLAAATQKADAASPALIGIFHSHPAAPAVPSEQDMALVWDFPTYAVLSLLNPDNESPALRCYRPQTGRPWQEQAVMIHNG